MSTRYDAAAPDTVPPTNGSGAAAILSAGIGCFVVAALAIVGDKFASVKGRLVFYTPTGPLSGVTTVAIVVWLVTWATLEWRWRKQIVPAGRINAIALALLVLSLILTFPPIGDVL